MTSTHKAGISAIALASLLAAPAFARAEATNTAAGTQPRSDAARQLTPAEKRFIADSANTNDLEVQLGKLAMQKATSNDVKSFAERMIHDHSQAQGKLKQIADSCGVPLPTQLDVQGQQEMQKLSALNGKAFDVAYMSFNVPAHEQVLKQLRHSEADLTNPALKHWDKQTIAVVEQHVKMAQATDRAIASEKNGMKTGGGSSSY